MASVDLEIEARTRAPDGSRIGDTRRIRVRSVDALPDPAALDRIVDELAGSLAVWRTAEVPEEPYIGPLLVEGDAAVELFRRLMLPALEGTPPPERPSEGSRMFSFGSGSDAPTLGLKRRLLPPGWTVRDDPTRDPQSPAWRTHDEEGTPVQPIDLVTDGVVRTHFSSRTPSKSVSQSNGHGLAGLGELVKGSPMSTTVEPPRITAERRIHKEAMKLTSTYGNDHYLVIRRFRPGSASRIVRMFGSGASALDHPVTVVRVYADGREEPLRGVAIEGLDRRALRDIVAAGPSSSGVFNSSGDRYALQAPTVLLEEVEVKPDNESAEKPPPLASPLARE
jgi:predicted Zn-dependent protease